MQTGQVIRESVARQDPVTGRRIWQLTQAGEWNMTPWYHRDVCFDRSSRFLYAATLREGVCHLVRFSVEDRSGVVLASWAQTPELSDTFRFMHSSAGGFVTVHAERQIINVDGDSGEQTVVVSDLGEDYRVRGVCPGLDGSHVIFTRSPSLRQKGITDRLGLGELYRAYTEHFGGIPTDFVRLDLATGAEEIVHHEPQAGCDHIHPGPQDGDEWLIDLNFPPLYSWYGDDGQTTRCWLLDTRTGTKREMRPRNANRFQMHGSWSGDGSLIFYHGRDKETGTPIGQTGGGHYIGAIRRDGEVVWERVFPDLHYGHVCPHPRRNTILLNGGLTADLLLELDFADSGSSGVPRLDILCRHGSAVKIGGIATYPSPHVSPDGRWLAFHAFDGQRTDLFLLELEEG
ncbi:MAG: hypothetical protein OHK0029_29130 [Armatimonadaceae bacterium]